MSSAVEIFMRRREAEQRLEPMQSLIAQMTQGVFRQMLDTKVPLIRYGRRKRRYRRLFERDIAARRVAFDGQALTVETVTTGQFYR